MGRKGDAQRRHVEGPKDVVSDQHTHYFVRLIVNRLFLLTQMPESQEN